MMKAAVGEGSAQPFMKEAFMTFGAGFLMRPLGGIFPGTYIDHYGRRAGLMPGYATLGALAPVIVVVGRLIQGFSAGVELGGVSVYLAEIAMRDLLGHGGTRTHPPFVAHWRYPPPILAAKADSRWDPPPNPPCFGLLVPRHSTAPTVGRVPEMRAGAIFAMVGTRGP